MCRSGQGRGLWEESGEGKGGGGGTEGEMGAFGADVAISVLSSLVLCVIPCGFVCGPSRFFLRAQVQVSSVHTFPRPSFLCLGSRDIQCIQWSLPYTDLPASCVTPFLSSHCWVQRAGCCKNRGLSSQEGELRPSLFWSPHRYLASSVACVWECVGGHAASSQSLTEVKPLPCNSPAQAWPMCISQGALLSSPPDALACYSSGPCSEPRCCGIAPLAGRGQLDAPNGLAPGCQACGKEDGVRNACHPSCAH